MFNLLRFLFWLSPENDGSGGGGPGNNGNGSGQNAGSGQNQEQKRSFTQAELDTLFAQRGEQGASAKEKQLLEALGVKTLDEAKAILTKARELEQSQLTELQKAQQEATDAKTAKDLAEKAKTDALAQANERLMRGAVLALAGNFQDANDAWALVERSKITVGDDGEVKGAKEAVEALAKAKPHLLKGTQAGPRGTPRPAGKSSSSQTTETPRKKIRF